jgi:hypothetical protein
MAICKRRFEKGDLFYLGWRGGVHFSSSEVTFWVAPAPTMLKADPRNAGFTAFSTNCSWNSSNILRKQKEVEENLYSSLKGLRNTVKNNFRPWFWTSCLSYWTYKCCLSKWKEVTVMEINFKAFCQWCNKLFTTKNVNFFHCPDLLRPIRFGNWFHSCRQVNRNERSHAPLGLSI